MPAEMSTFFLWTVGVMARFQMWWSHRMADLANARAELLNGYIVSVVKYDLNTCERYVWYKMNWFDITCLVLNKWYGGDLGIMMLTEFHGPRYPSCVYEVTMGDGTIVLVRESYVHADTAPAGTAVDGAGDDGAVANAVPTLAPKRHVYLYCTFDNGLNVTDYINQRWQSLTKDLAISARDLLTIVNASGNGRSYGRKLPSVNKVILRAMHGTSLEMQVFVEDDLVIMA